MSQLSPGIAKTVDARTHAIIGALILGLWVFGFASHLSAETGSATEAMKGTIDQALQVLRDESLKAPEKARERVEILENIIAKRFDYKEMGKRTLGKHWRKLSEADRDEFVSLFQHFLSRTYAGNVEGYSGEQVEYLKERKKGDFAEVQTAVTSEKSTISIHYRMLKGSNAWKVYDVVLDGVSLVKNFRSQFGRIIEAESVEGLLERLRTKTARTRS